MRACLHAPTAPSGAGPEADPSTLNLTPTGRHAVQAGRNTHTHTHQGGSAKGTGREKKNAAVNAACSAVLSAIVAASVHLERRPQQRDESEHSRWCEHHSETSLNPVSLNSPGEEITPSYSDNWLPIP